MNENLINHTTSKNSKDNNTIIQENILLGEAKKMSYIKYFNLFFSIFRFFLMFYLIALFEFPNYILNASFLRVFLFLFSNLYMPLFTIFNLILVITGVLGRNFTINTASDTIIEAINCICCWCKGLCTRNVQVLKIVNFIFALISLFIFCIFLCDFLYYIRKQNNIRFFPNLKKRYMIKLVLYFFDSFLLLCQSYFFSFHEYFLKRAEIYIEFYKRLIIKNRQKEAELVRNELPSNMDNFLINRGTEMQNV